MFFWYWAQVNKLVQGIGGNEICLEKWKTEGKGSVITGIWKFLSPIN